MRDTSSLLIMVAVLVALVTGLAWLLLGRAPETRGIGCGLTELP